MLNRQVGLIGARSLVGAYLIPKLHQSGHKITAFSRRKSNCELSDGLTNIDWKLIDAQPPIKNIENHVIEYWISLAPIWTLPQMFHILQAYGVKRIVVLSSTSLFTKEKSNNFSEQSISSQLALSEENLKTWSKSHGVEWTVLRPTLIYDGYLDKNISEIAKFIRLFHFFPVLGEAKGLRQPIHAADVAAACVAALDSKSATDKAYNISGSETVTYRNMVLGVFNALGMRPRLLTVPLWLFCCAVSIVRILPRYRKWTSAMAERMNIDMIFSHDAAFKDFSFSSRSFDMAVNTDLKVAFKKSVLEKNNNQI